MDYFLGGESGEQVRSAFFYNAESAGQLIFVLRLGEALFVDAWEFPRVWGVDGMFLTGLC